MPHRLEPFDESSYLHPDQVVARLEEEFAYCAASKEQGSDSVGDVIAKLIEMNAPQEIIDQQLAAQSSSIEVVIADDSSSDNYLQFTVIPNEGIFISYFSRQHQDATKQLVDRCAMILNYRVELL